MKEEMKREVVVKDGRAFGFTPEDPEIFIRKMRDALNNDYMDDAKKKRFASDFHEFLKRQVDSAAEFAPLYVIGDVAKRCGPIVAEMLLEEMNPPNLVRKLEVSLGAPKSVQFAWSICHLNGEIEPESLRKDADRISENELQNLFADWSDCWKTFCKESKAFEKLPAWDVGRGEASKKLQNATERYQSARTALLTFIGPNGKPFDLYHKYDEDWKLACKSYEEERKKESKLSGRQSFRPDPKAMVQNRRAKYISQAKLAREAHLSSRTIRRMESKNPGSVEWKTISRVAKVFDVPPESLVSNEDRGGGGT